MKPIGVTTLARTVGKPCLHQQAFQLSYFLGYKLSLHYRSPYPNFKFYIFLIYSWQVRAACQEHFWRDLACCFLTPCFATPHAADGAGFFLKVLGSLDLFIIQFVA